LSRLLAEKLSPRELGLLQQNRHLADKTDTAAIVGYWTNNGHSVVLGLDGSAANDPKRYFAAVN
jgi:hypothetical protein